MRDALGGDVRSILRLGENEGALERGLDVEAEAFRRPLRIRRIARFCGGNITGEHVDMRGQMTLAGSADRRVGFVGLLDQRAEQAGEVAQVRPCRMRDAEIDIGEEPVERIGQASV